MNDRSRITDRERGCNDVPCFLLLIGMVCGMIGVGVIAFRDGDVGFLETSGDSEGNVCGKGVPPHNITVGDWSRMKFQWSTVYNNTIRALCVTECPTYHVDSLNYVGYPSTPPSLVTYSSTLQYGRCIPVGVADVAVVDFYKSKEVVSKEMYTAAADVFHSEKTIAVIGAIACGCAIMWTFMLTMRITEEQSSFSFVTLGMSFIIVQCSLAGLGVAAYTYSGDVNSISDHKEFWKAIGIVLFVFAGLFFMLSVYLWGHFSAACFMLDEVSKVTSGFYLKLITSFALALIVCLTYYSLSVIVRLSSINKVGDYGLRTIDNDKANLIWFIFIGWFWVCGFLNAVCYICVSCYTVLRYYNGGVTAGAVEGDGETADVILSISWTVFYYLGSAAFGSFMIPIMQPIRLLFRIAEGPMRDARSGGAEMCSCCIQCCISQLEGCLHQITKSTYVLQILFGNESPPLSSYGTSMSPAMLGYLRSGRFAKDVFFNKTPDIMVTTFKTDAFLITAKFAVIGIASMIGWQLFSISSLCDAEASTAPMIITVAVVFFIVSCVFTTYMAALDAIIVCYCYDMAWPTERVTESSPLKAMMLENFGAVLQPQPSGAVGISTVSDGRMTEPRMSETRTSRAQTEFEMMAETANSLAQNNGMLGTTANGGRMSAANPQMVGMSPHNDMI